MHQLAFQILFFLRVAQLVGTTVTVHNTCNLIYFHVILHQDIPRGEVIVFFAVSLVFLGCAGLVKASCSLICYTGLIQVYSRPMPLYLDSGFI
jgi:hypothetical protein